MSFFFSKKFLIKCMKRGEKMVNKCLKEDDAFFVSHFHKFCIRNNREWLLVSDMKGKSPIAGSSHQRTLFIR